jgi:hypothetical protein
MSQHTQQSREHRAHISPSYPFKVGPVTMGEGIQVNKNASNIYYVSGPKFSVAQDQNHF